MGVTLVWVETANTFLTMEVLPVVAPSAFRQAKAADASIVALSRSKTAEWVATLKVLTSLQYSSKHRTDISWNARLP